MHLDAFGADAELLGDVGRRQPARDGLKDLQLTWGQFGDRRNSSFSSLAIWNPYAIILANSFAFEILLLKSFFIC